MKHQLTKTCLLCAALLAPMVAATAQDTQTLTILHTNDVHSRIEPLSKELSNPTQAGNGGLLRVAAYVNEVRQETPNLLVFDCGDFSQGTPYYNFFKGELEVKLMNAIGYDALTIGNHEFDFGLENLAHLADLAQMPMVCANYDFTGTPLEDKIKPYVIVRKNGLKVGVFGLGVNPQGLVAEENYAPMTYLDPFETANKVAARLKSEGCHVVICLSHLGLRPSATKPEADIELAKRTRNIDVILGGHSHTLMEEGETYNNLDDKPVTISQMGKSGIYVGRVDITFEKQ